MKIVAFSKEIPKKFKRVNWFILIPILFWPLVFFGTIFFFDDPNANPLMVWSLFIGVNLYPIYLIVFFELNARLYKKVAVLAYVLPLLIIGSLSFIIVREYISSNQFAKEREIANQNRQKEGYIGNCNTYKVIDETVSYRDTIIVADSKSFEYLSCHYGKDKKQAYKGKEPIIGSDPESFKIVNYQWQKDKNRYYYQGQALENIDYQTFEILDLGYSKDKNAVYYKRNIVEKAEPKTFVINRMNGIGKDKENKFEYGKIITTTNNVYKK
ncbi:MAG TPA: DKNYY domain-containing protein [Edaphocola sp.]|nr:DKNYY domain-containing protein [Edaphocola sp.]